MGRSTGGVSIEQMEKELDAFPKLPADHPLFNSGFIIGMRRSGSSLKPGQTPPPASTPSEPDWTFKEVDEED